MSLLYRRRTKATRRRWLIYIASASRRRADASRIPVKRRSRISLKQGPRNTKKTKRKAKSYISKSSAPKPLPTAITASKMKRLVRTSFSATEITQCCWFLSSVLVVLCRDLQGLLALLHRTDRACLGHPRSWGRDIRRSEELYEVSRKRIW